jgi:hypothetical protein
LHKTLLNLNQKHLEIASLNLLHDYYFDKVIPNIELIPFPQTALFLKNYRLILKQVDSSMVILQEGRYEDSIWVPKITIDNKHRLMFGIKFNDNMFQTKTNVPFYKSKNQKFFLDINENQVPNIDAVLTVFPCLSGDFEDLKPLIKKVGFKVEQDEFEIPIDELNSPYNLLPGLYTFYYNDDTEYTFMYINFDDSFDGIASFAIAQTSQNIFNYNFSSRLIHWEYILVSNYLSDLENCLISDDKSEMEFAFSEKTDEAYIFTSSKPIALRERYPNSLSLERLGEKLLNLSFPELKNFSLKSENVKNSVNKYFLSTYVNL